MSRGRQKQYHLYTRCGNKYYNVKNFLSKVVQQANGCHLWTGPKHVQGYGMCGGVWVDSDQRFMTVTHRAAMEIHLGQDLNSDQAVVHIPGCPANCVNPQHLQVGDLRLRNAVMTANGRAGRAKRGPNSTPLGKQNRQYKYTEDEIQRIRSQPTDLTAAQFGWTRQQAAKMRWEMRRKYTWLPLPELKETK